MNILLPLCLGVFAVLQAGLNKKFGESWSLSRAVLMNSFVLFLFASLVFLYLKFSHSFENSLYKNEVSQGFQWWYCLPGLFGFFLVTGLPCSISTLGSTTTFISVIAAQLITSVIWDHLTDGHPVTIQKLSAVALVMFGVVLVHRG